MNSKILQGSIISAAAVAAVFAFGAVAFAAATPTTNPATNITTSDATLNGTSDDAATGSAFWVSTSTFAVSASNNPSLPDGVYSTGDTGAVAATTAFSAQLTSVHIPAGFVITPNTTYYFVAWTFDGTTWTPGAVLNFATASPAPAPCTSGVPAAASLLVDHTQNITNDPDSSVPGPNWALDNFSRHIQIWQESGVYCAEADDSGTFTSNGTISPQSGAALPEHVTGSFVGKTHGEITGGTFNAANNPADVDCNATPSTCSNGLTSFWVSSYFGGSGSYDYGTRTDGWGWTYNGGANGTWVNANAGNTGDILHVASSAVYVNATGGNDSNDGSQAHPFATIQAAVNAVASGGMVNVASGTYDSFSVVNKTGITIMGAGVGSTTVTPSILVDTGTGHKYTADVQASVFVSNSTNVVIEDMTIQSTSETPGSAGGADAIVFWNNSSGTIASSNITGTYIINGAQTGQGIAVDASTGTNTLAVNNVNISGFQKNAIEAIDGNGATSGATDSTTVTVTGGSFTGAGATSTIAQNGLVSWNRGMGTVTATVNGTTISGFDYIGASTAAGILAYGGGSVPTVHNSIFSTDNQLNLSTTAGSPAIDATMNYWGSASGPATSTLDGAVSFSPWFTDAGMTTLQYTTSTSTATTTVMTGSSETTLEGTSTTDGSVNVTVEIPAGTTITGDTTWDGILNPPTATTATVTVSGFNVTTTSAVTIGSSESDLTFDKAVQMTFTGEAGQHVGWYNHAGTFTEITTTCTDNTQATNDGLAAGGSCKIDESGNLVVWTKHFSTFVTYTQTAVVTSGGGSGGGGGGGGGNGPIASGGSGGGGGVAAVALPNNGGAPGGTSGTVTTGGSTGGGAVLGASTYNFTKDLTVGSTGPDVVALQQILLSAGFQIPALTSGAASYGYFGVQTRGALALYQSAHKISPAAGYFGPITRASFNLGVTPTMSDEQRALLIQSLQNQLNGVLQAIANLKAQGITS